MCGLQEADRLGGDSCPRRAMACSMFRLSCPFKTPFDALRNRPLTVAKRCRSPIDLNFMRGEEGEIFCAQCWAVAMNLRGSSTVLPLPLPVSTSMPEFRQPSDPQPSKGAPSPLIDRIEHSKENIQPQLPSQKPVIPVQAASPAIPTFSFSID